MIIGSKHSKEVREHLSLVRKGRTSPVKGTRNIEKTCKRCSKSFTILLCHSDRVFCSKSCASVGNQYNVGRVLSEETRRKMGEARKGEKNWRWIVNRDELVRRNRSDSRSVEWRKSVFERDLFKCRAFYGECRGQLESHHILPWRDYESERYNINNGITLCHAHHPRKRAEENLLIPVFQGLVIKTKEIQFLP